MSLLARADLGRRWRAVVVLGVLGGITAGLALGCWAGARRSATALERLRSETHASDAVVFAAQVGVDHPRWDVLARRSEVHGLAPWAVVYGAIGGGDVNLFTPLDRRWMQQIDAPVVVEGRAFDPLSSDELVVTESLAATDGLAVGQTVRFVPASRDGSGPRPIRLRVVGIIRTPFEQLVTGQGIMVTSPALLKAHPKLLHVENASVQLPALGMPALRADVNRDIADGTPVLDEVALGRRVTTSTDVEGSALFALGVAIAAAGLAIAGQALARSASVSATDAPVLRAIGATRRSVATAAALAHVPAVVVATGTALATMVVLSSQLPLGLSGRLDPHRGLALDGTVAAVGMVGLLVAMLGGAFVTAWASARPPRTAPTRHPTTFGVTLRSGRAASAAPARPALLAAVVGVLGVVAAATLGAGLDHAVDHPASAGVVWDVDLAPGDPALYTDTGFAPSFIRQVRGVDGIGDFAQVDTANLPIDDATGVPTYSIRPEGTTTSIAFVTVEGRAPASRGEVALGRATARVLGRSIGDHVLIGTQRIDEVVVGLALFAPDIHSEFGQGAWIEPADFDRLHPPPEASRRFIAVRPAARTEVDRLVVALRPRMHGGYADAAELPPELVNLRNVRRLPNVLSAFLALLAVAALIHVLFASARVEAHDLAVLRALGMGRRSRRLVFCGHGAAVAAAGVAIGIPAGIAIGTTAWRLLAERVPLDVERHVPIGTVALIGLVAVVVAVAIALAADRIVRPTGVERLRVD